MKDLRKDYELSSFNDQDADKDPARQFSLWFDEAVKSGISEPNAFTLSTASKIGMPSSRVLLLKDFNPLGFTFYTNYDSRKGQEIKENPNAAMLFFWPELERQVRIEGSIERAPALVSDHYFSSRPLEAKISAAVSNQSEVIANREDLDKRWQEMKVRFESSEVTRPSNWGGYTLKPRFYEFWQGRENRLHDRVTYTFTGNEWTLGRLSP